MAASISSTLSSTPLSSPPVDSDAIVLRVAGLELKRQAEAHAAERAMLLNSLREHTITAIAANETETKDQLGLDLSTFDAMMKGEICPENVSKTT